MNQPSESTGSDSAEFDNIADVYYNQHKQNTAAFGESPEYFGEYKVADVAALASRRAFRAKDIFDFGCGIGNSIPYFSKYFQESRLIGGDVSRRSIELARERFPGGAEFVHIRDAIPLESESQDVVFSACVFHHIPHDEHVGWFAELRRLVRPGGLLAVFELKPYNPLTVRAVNTCPFDKNAKLIKPGVLRRRAIDAGWQEGAIDYRLFFPGPLRAMRVFEPQLSKVPLGAQYRLTAWRR